MGSKKYYYETTMENMRYKLFENNPITEFGKYKKVNSIIYSSQIYIHISKNRTAL